MIDEAIVEAYFLYEGTEYIKVEDLMKLTQGKGVEIHCETREGTKIILTLHSKCLKKGHHSFFGSVHIEERIDEPR